MCLALGHGSLAATLALPAAEFAFWGQFYRKYGFPTDRLEAAIALAGAAVCRSNGAKVEAKDLIPKFGRRSARSLAGAFAGIPGAKVERKVRKDTPGGGNQ